MIRTDKKALAELKSGGYWRFRFGELKAGSGVKPRLELINNGSGPLKVGLVRPRQRINYSEVYGTWQNPRRTEDGRVKLESPRSGMLDFRLESKAIEPGLQLALAFYKHRPSDWRLAAGVIMERLKSDRSFLIFHLGILGILAIGIAALAPVGSRR